MSKYYTRPWRRRAMEILPKTLEKESDGDPMQDPGEGE